MSAHTAKMTYHCELAATQELNLSLDEFWMMTFRELKQRVRGHRLRSRMFCSFHAVVAQYVAASAMTKGRPPSIKSIVNGLLGPPPD